MICPNCHSDQIIAVQDQHFCINCGQMVPETTTVPTVPLVPTKGPRLRLPKKRPPGRPRATHLDAPRPELQPTQSPQASNAPKLRHPKHPVAISPDAPKPAAIKPATRRLTDLAPPKPAHHQRVHRPPVHKVGVAPLHYGAVVSASLRARAKPHWLGLAAIAALAFGAAFGFVAWLTLTDGLPQLASRIVAVGPRLWTEVIVLSLLYYIGRSIGHTAIIYGLAREADARPVGLGQQLGVGINTFGRRLALDLGFGLAELVMLAGIVGLVIAGGGVWPMSSELQLTALFIIFLALLYCIAALALTRNLGGVILTVSSQKLLPAARLGWQLFSHRFELIGWRFLMLALELLLAIPLAALAVGLIIAVPAAWQIETAMVVGLLAWLAGALFGAGTASWWTALYSKLVAVTIPDAPPALLTGQPATDARRGPLTLIVALSSFLIAAALAIPWLAFTKN
jgi:hypothetical protein